MPEVDSVLFTSPKNSAVDIAQAVGRALRHSPGTGGTATIIIPVVVPGGQDEPGDLDAGEYAMVWQVVRALRAHDEPFGIALDARRAALAAGGDPQLPAKVTVRLPPGASEDVIRSIALVTIRQSTSGFWEGVGYLREFHHAHGHPHVHRDYTAEDGFRLGNWCHLRRQDRRRGWLRPAHARALEETGFEFEPLQARWHALLAALREFRARHGHLNVPASYVTESGYRLGQAVQEVRPAYRDGTLPAGRAAALRELGLRPRGAHVRLGRSVAEVAPHLVPEWDHDANDGLTPADVPASSTRPIGWVCARGHRWKTVPHQRVRLGHGCTRCAQWAPPGESLADLHPAVAAQLAPGRNGDITADELRPASNRRLWWQCEHGHQWQAPVNRRTARGTGCPHCRRLREGGTRRASSPAPLE